MAQTCRRTIFLIALAAAGAAAQEDSCALTGDCGLPAETGLSLLQKKAVALSIKHQNDVVDSSKQEDVEASACTGSKCGHGQDKLVSDHYAASLLASNSSLNHSDNIVTDNAPGVGGWGGSCTCPNGATYEVGDNYNYCGSLACVGGVSGTCHKSNGPWSRRKVVCAQPAADTATATGSTDIATDNAPGVGGWGGMCTCPDGTSYQVGDNFDACGSLACVGGTSGTCNKYNGPWSRRNVVCAAPGTQTVATDNAPRIGGWGGSCTCPDGTTYQVGDNYDYCGSLACIGGVSGTCNKRNGPWSRRKVVCGAAPPTGNVVTVNAPRIGGWGGSCTCPDGATYEVGDNYDYCGSLACVGGTSGTCNRRNGPWSKRKVVCASVNTVTMNVPRVGGWGGSCTCPDGTTYQVGDNYDYCGSLACVGGISGTCTKHNGPWSRRKVVCATPPTEAPPMPPTEAPTMPPTEAPTMPPTEAPTMPPTEAPTMPPTEAPTMPPTEAPTMPPTEAPTMGPTEAPTMPPTEAPTMPPTVAPTMPPTVAPTMVPTWAPTKPPGGDMPTGGGHGDIPPECLSKCPEQTCGTPADGEKPECADCVACIMGGSDMFGGSDMPGGDMPAGGLS